MRDRQRALFEEYLPLLDDGGRAWQLYQDFLQSPRSERAMREDKVVTAIRNALEIPNCKCLAGIECEDLIPELLAAIP